MTANNPQVPSNLVVYNFVDKEYKVRCCTVLVRTRACTPRVLSGARPHAATRACARMSRRGPENVQGVPGSADEHIAAHLTLVGGVMHTDSEDAAEQRSWEKAYRSTVEERRRDRLRAAQEEGKELSEMDLDDDLQRNQFNFTERAAQTYTATIKSRVISTVPPETSQSSGQMTQWLMYDAYMAEYDRLAALAAAEKAGSKASTAAGASASVCYC
ncbi:hypothetical protein EON68_01640, partial [archaeon]